MKIKESLINLFQEIISKHYTDNYPSRKVDEITYFKEILYVLRSHTYWSRYRGPINWKVLHNKHMEYIKRGFYDELFKLVIQRYIQSQGYYILKIQSTDTSFIPNKYCKKLPRNKFYKSKRGVKISSINDVNGIPLSLIVTEGSVNDSKVLMDTYNEMYTKPQANKYSKSNRHKQHFLADKGYDSAEIRTTLKNEGYDTIIAYNKRNTKDVSKLKKLTAKEKVIYKKRIKVENYYSWIKQYPKLMFVFTRNMKNFEQLLYLVNCILISNRFF